MRLVARRMHHLLTPPSVRYAIQGVLVKTHSLGPNYFLRGCRHFTKKADNYVQLKSKEFRVNPGFGIFRTTGCVDCIIKPTNPQDYPDADRAFVTVYGEASAPCHDIIIEVTGELKDALTLTAFPNTSLMYCEIQLPIKYDLDIKLIEEAGVQIFGMEADEVKINTNTGNIKTKGLKSHNIHISTKMGNITAEGTLQGNIFISAKKTCITAKRLQGMAMSIEADDLNTAIESSYMTQGEITAHRGNINVKNLHGCTDLALRNGDISIRGLHGQISGFLGSGNMDVQVTDVTGNSALHLHKGDMSISILEDPRHDLEVTAPSLEVASELKTKGVVSTKKSQTFALTTGEDSDKNTLIATVVNGTAKLKCQDWFSTLGIKSN